MTDQKMYLPIEYLMGRYAPAYPVDATWAEAMDHLMGDPVERRIVLELMRQRHLQGGFREPVRLDEGDHEYPPSVGNGMHRITATYLLGERTVWVSHEDPDDWDGMQVVTKVWDLPEDLDLIDLAMGDIRSFPLSEDEWVEMAFSSVIGGVGTLVWHADPSSPYILARLTTKVYDTMIKEWGDICGARIRTYVENFFED